MAELKWTRHDLIWKAIFRQPEGDRYAHVVGLDVLDDEGQPDETPWGRIESVLFNLRLVEDRFEEFLHGATVRFEAEKDPFAIVHEERRRPGINRITSLNHDQPTAVSVSFTTGIPDLYYLYAATAEDFVVQDVTG